MARPQVNSADELILTELILENKLATFEPEEVVALLSCFVFQEKTDVEPVIPPKLEEGRDAILDIASKVGAVQDRWGVQNFDAETKLKFGLVEVVYEWAKGMVRVSESAVLVPFHFITIHCHLASLTHLNHGCISPQLTVHLDIWSSSPTLYQLLTTLRQHSHLNK